MAESLLLTPLDRIERLIRESITRLELDLGSLCVLTEAATGYYSLTPIIAAMANSRGVVAVARASEYGSVDQIRELFDNLLRQFRLDGKVFIVKDVTREHLRQSDIVTNLGWVRPINRGVIKALKPTSVIPLMHEPWEYREQDVDLGAAYEHGIPVLGTDETNRKLAIHKYMSLLVVKHLLNLDIEVRRSRLVVMNYGSDPLTPLLVSDLRRIGAYVSLLTEASDGKGLTGATLSREISEADALIVSSFLHDGVLIGPGGEITASGLKELNPGIRVVHLAGSLAKAELQKVGIHVVPPGPVPKGHVALTLDRLGPRPLIELHTAGLKVGEALAKARLNGLSYEQAIQHTVKVAPAKKFPPTIMRKYSNP